MNNKLKQYKKEIKSIHRIFARENISARIVDVIDKLDKTMYYIEYTRNICPYEIAKVVDSFAIALGGVKLCFIPVIEGKPYSALMIEKCVENVSKKQPYEAANKYLEDQEYKKIVAWLKGQKYTSISDIQREFGLGFNTSSKIFMKLMDMKLISKKSSRLGYEVLI